MRTLTLTLAMMAAIFLCTLSGCLEPKADSGTESGTIAQTSVDSTLVQSHIVTITGLLHNTLYSVKALSSTLGGQNAVSDERAFRTPR